MTNLGKWIRDQQWFSKYTCQVPKEVGIYDVVLAEDEVTTSFPTKAKHFSFIAADGPLPLGLMSQNVVANTTPFADRLPSSLEPTLKRLEDLSSEAGAPRYVYNHRFIPGNVATKTTEFYRNWAVSSKYRPGLSYLVVGKDDRMIDAALGFHEQNCWLYITNPQLFINIGALRLKLGVEIGKGDTTRRVNDLRALSLLANGNGFQTGISVSLQDLIMAYQSVTAVPVGQVYLVDGEHWNIDVLQKLLNKLPDNVSKKVDDETCKRFFRYMAWALQLFNGFCPDFDFRPPRCQINPTDLLTALPLFGDSVLFEDQSEILRDLPGAVLRLCQEGIPPDAPAEVLAHESDVFAPLIRKKKSRKIEDVLERYRSFVGQVPDLDNNRYWAPVMCRRGERSIVPLVKSDPDFGSVFRIAPLVGDVVVIMVDQKMAVGLVRQIIDKQSCRVQLYHIALPPVQLPVDVRALEAYVNTSMRATYIGHIECDFADLLWKRNTRTKQRLRRPQLGDWSISFDRGFFGFVGVFMGPGRDKSVKLIGNVNQSLSRFRGITFFAPCVCRFDQMPPEQLREIVAQGHL